MALRGQDLWRRHPIFKWTFTDFLPGFREGAALFAAYVAADWTYGKMNPDAAHGHHGAEHNHGHHQEHHHVSFEEVKNHTVSATGAAAQHKLQ